MSRVIFLPDDYFTNPPKETTVTDNYADNPRAGDARRASALTIHHRQGSTAGLVEIVRETCENGRATELVLAILEIHRSAIVQLRSEVGLEYLGCYVGQLAAGAAEHEDSEQAADIARSADLLDAHARGDVKAINKAMREAVAAGRPTELVTNLLNLYEVLLPELSSEPGIRWLRTCVGTFAGEEAEGDL